MGRGAVSVVTEEGTTMTFHLFEQPLTTKTVLIVEDDERLARALRRLLVGDGWDVTSCTTATQALDLVLETSFDVVLSDYAMPEMNGIDFLRQVADVAPESVRLLTTAHTQSDVMMQAMNSSHVFAFLPKPVGAEELLHTMDAALRSSRPMRNSQVAAFPLLRRQFTQALDELWMAFQPIVSQGGELRGVEALLRTHAPDLNTPLKVLDAAEQLGSIQELGRVVRARTAQQMDEHPDLTVFVNLHPHELADSQLYDPAAPLSRFASRVVLELTERAAIEDVVGLKDRVKQLRAMGYRLAIDDLGNGYAGLTMVALVEPDVVKIEMGLIRDIDRDIIKQKLVGSIAKLCTDLGILTVAEGIETPAERDMVVALGCSLLQGYLLGKPGKWPTAARGINNIATAQTRITIY